MRSASTRTRLLLPRTGKPAEVRVCRLATPVGVNSLDEHSMLRHLHRNGEI